MMKPIKLMIIGKMGTGKGLAADYVTERHGAYRFTRSELMKKVCFALVNGLGSLDGFLERLYPGDVETQDKLRDDLLRYAAHYVEEPGKPRKLFQEVTDLVLGYNPLAYDQELAQRISTLKPDGAETPIYLIDDVRSLEGYQYYHDLGYCSLRMDADLSVRRLRMLRRDGYLPSLETFNHPSETALDGIRADYTIQNNGDEPTGVYLEIDSMIQDLRSANA
jgi:hypothetical protein